MIIFAQKQYDMSTDKAKTIKSLEHPNTYSYLKALYLFLCLKKDLLMDEWLRQEFDKTFSNFIVFRDSCSSIIQDANPLSLCAEFYCIPGNYDERDLDITISARLYNLILDGYISNEFDNSPEGKTLKQAMCQERDMEDLAFIKREIVKQIRFERLRKQALEELESEGYDIESFLKEADNGIF